MKQNKPALIAIAAVLLVALGATAAIFINSKCTLNGNNVCYISEENVFAIEQDASLDVQVESEALGNYLVKTWDELHPDNQGALRYHVAKPLSIETLQEGNPHDIMVVSQTDAVYFLNQFKDMGRKVDSVVGTSAPQQIQDTINAKGYYMVQNSVDGPVFAYNKTLMESLGYDLTDADDSGLPDVFESWELIQKASPDILEKLEVVFPLTFTDQNSFYPFLTSGRWTLNFTKKGSDAGFNSREFKEGLEFIASLNETIWDKTTVLDVPIETEEDMKDQEAPKENEEKPKEDTPKEETPKEEGVENKEEENTETPSESEEPEKVEPPKTKKMNTAESLKWRYDEAFFNRKTMFTVVYDFDLTASYEKSTGDEYVFAPFPSYEEHRLAPMANYVDGYVVSESVEYPSAAAEVLRILRTPEAVSIYAESTSKVPVYHRLSMGDLTIENKHTVERIRAYNFSDSQPVIALDNNPNVLAKWLYRDVDFMPILRELYDGKITVEQAQEQIIALSKEWLEIYDIIEEES